MVKRRKKRKVPNNLIAVVVLFFGLVLTVINIAIILKFSHIGITGQFTSIVTGTATLCANTRPLLNISNCSTTGNSTYPYYCNVTGTDTDAGTILTFYDNTTIFNIGTYTGIINFTPSYYDEGIHYINISVRDGSNCSNDWSNDMLVLDIGSLCQGPYFNMTSLNYSVARNGSIQFTINATDPNNDTLVFYVTEFGPTETEFL